jgi:hypothetical protein
MKLFQTTTTTTTKPRLSLQRRKRKRGEDDMARVAECVPAQDSGSGRGRVSGRARVVQWLRGLLLAAEAPAPVTAPGARLEPQPFDWAAKVLLGGDGGGGGGGSRGGTEVPFDWAAQILLGGGGGGGSGARARAALSGATTPRSPPQQHPDTSSVRYALGSTVPFHEDLTHEFKVTSVDNVAHTVAKYATAFLNARGGTLYFGVSDAREVVGLRLSDGDRDMLQQVIANVLEKTCGVHPSLYQVSFREVFAAQAHAAPSTFAQPVFTRSRSAPAPRGPGSSGDRGEGGGGGGEGSEGRGGEARGQGASITGLYVLEVFARAPKGGGTSAYCVPSGGSGTATCRVTWWKHGTMASPMPLGDLHQRLLSQVSTQAAAGVLPDAVVSGLMKRCAEQEYALGLNHQQRCGLPLVTAFKMPRVVRAVLHIPPDPQPQLPPAPVAPAAGQVGKFRALLAEHPGGMRGEQVLGLFQQRWGEPLDYKAAGYDKLARMLGELSFVELDRSLQNSTGQGPVVFRLSRAATALLCPAAGTASGRFGNEQPQAVALLAQKLRQLFTEHPGGVRGESVVALFQQRFGESLDFKGAGYPKLALFVQTELPSVELDTSRKNGSPLVFRLPVDSS